MGCDLSPEYSIAYKAISLKSGEGAAEFLF